MNAAWSFNGFYFSWVKDGVGLLGDGGIRSGNHIKTIASYIAVVALEASANLRIVKYSEHSQLEVRLGIECLLNHPFQSRLIKHKRISYDRIVTSHPVIHPSIDSFRSHSLTPIGKISPASRTKAMWHQRICVYGLNTRYSETKTCKFSVRRWRVRK